MSRIKDDNLLTQQPSELG